jgi:hypothetical protein
MGNLDGQSSHRLYGEVVELRGFHYKAFQKLWETMGDMGDYGLVWAWSPDRSGEF